MMIRSTILLAVLLSAWSIEARQPNLIVIVADELGYGDLGCYRGAVPTPHLDALAAGGTKAGRYYTAASLSTPARASLLTGRYPERFGISSDFTGAGLHLPTNAPSLPRLLREAGYATAHVGRWDLGGFHRSAMVPGPGEHGFDVWSGREESPEPRASATWLRDGVAQATADGAALDRQFGEASRLLDGWATNAAPFFLNLWLDFSRAAGEPVPDQYLQPHAGVADIPTRRHRALVTQMDSLVGQLLAGLRDRGLETNTLVVFTGAVGAGPGASTRGFRGGNGTLLDGGLRVPFLIRWPGVVKAGRTVGPVLHSTDLLPTLCAAAGIRLAPELVTDGVNFLPYFQGQGAPPLREVTAWRQQPVPEAYARVGFSPPWPDEAVVYERWKVLFAAGKPVAVFNLFTDSGEVFNRVDDSREAKALEKVPPLLERWRSIVRDPGSAPRLGP